MGLIHGGQLAAVADYFSLDKEEKSNIAVAMVYFYNEGDIFLFLFLGGQ